MKIIGFCRALCMCGVLFSLFVQGQSHAQSETAAACRNEIDNAVRADRDGPLAVYQSADEKTLIEIKREDLEKEFIFANYVDRGIAPLVGQYAEPKLISFRLNGKKIDIIQKDTVVFFNEEETLGRTRHLTMSDAVVTSLKLHKCQPADTYFAYIDQSTLTSLSSDFLKGLSRGASPSSSELKGWSTFSDNVSFVSEHRLSGSPSPYSVAAGSNFTIRIRHILLQRPEPGFVSRRYDPRVGYFAVSRKDLGDFDQSASDSYIHRWRLEKKETEKSLSEPVKPIVFWIENTTPDKFRPYIKQGVLAWNEAFRAAGFENAIEVYEQPVDADWEAGDISKNVIRWQAAFNARGNFGSAPAIHDPVTGEILGSDIILNYSGIGDYVDDWTRLLGEERPLVTDPAEPVALQRMAELNAPNPDKISNNIPLGLEAADSRFEGSILLASLIEKHQNKGENFGSALSGEKIKSLTSTGVNPSPLNTALSDESGVSDAHAKAALSLTERMVKEVIIQLTMHEVGHSLGLSHNFRGSRWRSIDEIYDREKTDGVISASVMDYLPINFSPIGVEQGDFANTRLGPYDVWAIEFGYRPGINESERNDILQRAAMPENAFGIGRFGRDPHTLLNDLTSSPVDYAKSRVKFALDATELAGKTDAFQDQVHYFSLFLELRMQVFLAVNTISSQVAPFTTSATSAGNQSNGTFVTTRAMTKAEQRAAIKALEEMVFATDALPFSDEFVHRLGVNLYAMNPVHTQVSRSAMLQLMSQYSLMARHRAFEYGGEYSPTELLFDLKRAVFGNDLNFLARPDENRREQQIMYANQLAALINYGAADGGDRARTRSFGRSVISAYARPVRDVLLRELLMPTPLAPSDVRAHRQELRAILQ